jgi:hypothetical protein
MFKRILIALGLAGTPGLALPASLDECETRESISDSEERNDACTRSDDGKRLVIAVGASWDEEACLWTITRPPGLSMKAETFPVLVRKLKGLLPEQLAANNPWPDGVTHVSYIINGQVDITISRHYFG